VGRLRRTLFVAGLCLAALTLGNGHGNTLSFDWQPGDMGSGWVGTAHGAGATSAQQQYVRAMHVLSGIFDGPPTFWGVVSDRNDTIAQMPFLGVWRGTRIAGLAVALVQGGRTTIGVAFDDASLAPFTMDGLARQLGQHVPLIAPPGALQAAVWDRYRSPDGSSQVSAPRGWGVTFGEGSVEVSGPRGENVTLGFRQAPYLPEMGFWMPGVIVAPYQDPVSAVQTIWPTALNMVIQQVAVGRVLHYAGYPSQYGEQSAMILWEESWHGRPYLAYGYANTYPSAPSWAFYTSSVRAPAEVFGESFATMQGIWSSWEIDPQVHWQRMQSALRHIAEASDILHQTLLDTSRRRDARMYDWTEAYRGTAIVRDITTGEEMPANLAFVHETVDGLNQAAGTVAYEYVPLREW